MPAVSPQKARAISEATTKRKRYLELKELIEAGQLEVNPTDETKVALEALRAEMWCLPESVKVRHHYTDFAPSSQASFNKPS